jgi:hypothetical protein
MYSTVVLERHGDQGAAQAGLRSPKRFCNLAGLVYHYPEQERLGAESGFQPLELWNLLPGGKLRDLRDRVGLLQKGGVLFRGGTQVEAAGEFLDVEV